jgi:hypothetical protein
MSHRARTFPLLTVAAVGFGFAACGGLPSDLALRPDPSAAASPRLTVTHGGGASPLGDAGLNALWMNDDLTLGWAVGDNGTIIGFRQGRWQRDAAASSLASDTLRTVWMKHDGSYGFAAGDGPTMLRYEKWRWAPVAVDGTSLEAIWLNRDASSGWALGNGPTVLRFSDGEWSYDHFAMQAFHLFTYHPRALWMHDGDDRGWAVGAGGVVMRSSGSGWSQDTPASDLTLSDLNALWMSSGGTVGWAVGDDATVLRYRDEGWELDEAATRVVLADAETEGANASRFDPERGPEDVRVTPPPGPTLRAIWMDAAGTHGWIAADTGLIRFSGGRWQTGGPLPEGVSPRAVQARGTGVDGWAVGDGGSVIRISRQELGTARLRAEPGARLERLDGDFTLELRGAPLSPVEVSAIALETGVTSVMLERGKHYTVEPTTGAAGRLSLAFDAADLAARFAGDAGRLVVTVSYPDLEFPAAMRHVSPKFYLLARPAWQRWTLVALPFLLVQGLLVLLASRSSAIRRVILHPKGSALIGVVVGKFLVIDPLIHFVRRVRLALFRDYRHELGNAALLVEWRQREYVPPRVHAAANDLPEPDAARPEDERWQVTLRFLLRHGQGRLWLVQGPSGLGKTALLEKWTEQAVCWGETPLLVRLGSDSRPEEETAVLMAQYGDIHVTPAAAVDLLVAGGFVILLDGLNEERRPDALRELVRRVVRRNVVVLTSQSDPRWDSMVPTRRIVLKPFGRGELLKLMDERSVDAITADRALSRVAELPHTARLLADFVQSTGRTPSSVLEVYATLRDRLADSAAPLERLAWTLFKTNRTLFDCGEPMTPQGCDDAVDHGILTRVAERGQVRFRFSHERMHRFFVASFVDRQPARALADWQRELAPELPPEHWVDVLEFRGEMLASRVADRGVTQYEAFLREVARFSPQSFARVYRGAERLSSAFDKSFFEAMTAVLAQAAAQQPLEPGDLTSRHKAGPGD